MFEIKNIDKTWEVRFTEDEANPEIISALFAKAEIENILNDSKLTKDKVDELSKEIKDSYWNTNKEWILNRIGK